MPSLPFLNLSPPSFVPTFPPFQNICHIHHTCPIHIHYNVFEKLVNNRIVDHLEKYGLFSNFQYGFRSSWSSYNWSSYNLLTDLLTIVYEIARFFNRSRANQAVGLDISKVFDRVCLVGLLHKIKSYGISGQVFSLISCFLSKRLLQVFLAEKSPQKCNWITKHSSLWMFKTNLQIKIKKPFLGDRVWAPKPVYRALKRPGYVTDWCYWFENGWVCYWGKIILRC